MSATPRKIVLPDAPPAPGAGVKKGGQRVPAVIHSFPEKAKDVPGQDVPFVEKTAVSQDGGAVPPKPLDCRQKLPDKPEHSGANKMTIVLPGVIAGGLLLWGIVVALKPNPTPKSSVPAPASAHLPAPSPVWSSASQPSSEPREIGDKEIADAGHSLPILNATTTAAVPSIDIPPTSVPRSATTLTPSRPRQQSPTPLPDRRPTRYEAEYRSGGGFETKPSPRQIMPSIANLKVVNVPANDTLSLRSAPGSQARKLAAIPYNATGVKLLGDSQRNGRDVWFPVAWNGIRGWVHGSYVDYE